MHLAFASIASLLAVKALGQTCTPDRRVQIAMDIIAAFNEPDFEKSVAAINAMPLSKTCKAYVSVNGLPAINFGPDATTTYAFSNVVRQVFQHTTATYDDYGNGTLLMDAMVTLGVHHYVALPVYARVVVPIEFDGSCLITKLPAFVYVPVDILGHPVDPPIVPTIPGIETIPLMRGFLTTLLKQGLKPGAIVEGGVSNLLVSVASIVKLAASLGDDAVPLRSRMLG